MADKHLLCIAHAKIIETFLEENLHSLSSDIRHPLSSFHSARADSNVQPKMRLFWDNSTSKKYLKSILLFIEKNLQTSVARSTPENSNHGIKENP
jgi:hypothetical protein